ncbi:hypothetical protein [Neobacillus sp. LXY-1]|uniref:hypothetical protein n=1 Tax=Neobacillus sp. LXY-1 TaxID=3379133 RepID=UPI003EDF4062
MDVKYIPSDWEKMKDGIGDLIGLGRWGKGMIDNLKDLSENLEDAEDDIAKYDSDGVISFHHSSQKGKYQGLYEDFEVLHRFAGKVGDIVDRTIDQPFYEDMDAFVEAMRDLTISNYTTKNRIGSTETQFVYGGYGASQSFEVPKTEVSIDDLFNADNFYAGQMKVEYDAWKELNPGQDFSQEEYQQAALNTRAFQYESIRNQQENKEFWVQIGALVVIVGATLICPPAGIALGALYGAAELGSAVSGKDWVSGRELGTGERWFRGVLAPLDIVPGVSGLAKFSSTARLAHVGETTSQLGLKTGVNAGFRQGVNHIDNMIKTAGQHSVSRLKSASAAIKDAAHVVKNKLATDIIETGKLADTIITGVKNTIPSPKRLVVTSTGEKVYMPVENSHGVENSIRDLIRKIDGINIEGSKGTGNGKIQLGKEELDALRKKWNVPETNTIAVGKTDVKGLEGLTFEGGSPKVRKEAGLPDLDVSNPNRPIKSSGKIPSATRHAEEGVANQFVDAVEKLGIQPNDVVGTLKLHQSNPSGVCPTCLSGLGNPKKDPGVIKQLSLKYPNLVIEVTSQVIEGAKVNGRLEFKVKNGVYID